LINEFIAVGGIARNVTRRREAEQALQESEARLRQIIRQMPYPVEVCNPDGTVSIVNQAFLDMFGLASADLIVDRYNVFDDPIIMQHPGLKEAIAQLYSGKPVFIPEFTLPLEYYAQYGLQKKEPAVYELSMFPVLGRSQEIWQVVTIWIDISDRKQAENALRRSAERLQILYDIDQAILAAQTPEAIALAA
jgi:PAS domain-containing protein